MNITDISPWNLAAGYILFTIPLGIILWLHVPMFTQTIVSILRMTVQLLFVGFYLQVIFRLNNPWLNCAWLLVMIGVADISIIRGCGLKMMKFVLPLFVALIVGTSLPLLSFIGPVLKLPNLLEAQYVIPIGGMILGNCLRADIIGINNFYVSIRKAEKSYLNSLAQGARLREALRPFTGDAFQAALMPTVATMATIGLVALPGMMTGVILGGANPVTAIKYQIAIMIAIFSGTSITVFMAILLTVKNNFNTYGLLDHSIFKKQKRRSKAPDFELPPKQGEGFAQK
ncbi:MAG: ABC transporter permease [Deltaproteobacteria bacterium]|nr:ABC transporter permease [Deltaproteobacteria bacterium]